MPGLLLTNATCPVGNHIFNGRRLLGMCAPHYQKLKRHGVTEPKHRVNRYYIDDPLGYWLAGLIDGEGCFNIQPTIRANGFKFFTCSFSIALRADDRPCLESLHQQVGIGRIGKDIRQASNHTPMVCWIICRLADSLALIEILDKYPLRTRKAKDFTIWKEAVLNIRDRRKGSDWSDVAELQRVLREGRRLSSFFAEYGHPPCSERRLTEAEQLEQYGRLID